MKAKQHLKPISHENQDLHHSGVGCNLYYKRKPDTNKLQLYD